MKIGTKLNNYDKYPVHFSVLIFLILISLIFRRLRNIRALVESGRDWLRLESWAGVDLGRFIIIIMI